MLSSFEKRFFHSSTFQYLRFFNIKKSKEFSMNRYRLHVNLTHLSLKNKCEIFPPLPKWMTYAYTVKGSKKLFTVWTMTLVDKWSYRLMMLSFQLPYKSRAASCEQQHTSHMCLPGYSDTKWADNTDMYFVVQHLVGTDLKCPWLLLLHFYTAKARSTTISLKFCVFRKKMQVYSPSPINKAKSLPNELLAQL